MKYLVVDIETREVISPEFDTERDARIWIEENGVDYDFYEIETVREK